MIAVNGSEFRAVSVRTTTPGNYNKPEADRLYHVLAVVYLVGDDREVSLDGSQIFLIHAEQVATASTDCKNLDRYRFSRQLVEQFFIRLPA